MTKKGIVAIAVGVTIAVGGVATAVGFAIDEAIKINSLNQQVADLNQQVADLSSDNTEKGNTILTLNDELDSWRYDRLRTQVKQLGTASVVNGKTATLGILKKYEVASIDDVVVDTASYTYSVKYTMSNQTSVGETVVEGTKIEMTCKLPETENFAAKLGSVEQAQQTAMENKTTAASDGNMTVMYITEDINGYMKELNSLFSKTEESVKAKTSGVELSVKPLSAENTQEYDTGVAPADVFKRLYTEITDEDVLESDEAQKEKDTLKNLYIAAKNINGNVKVTLKPQKEGILATASIYIIDGEATDRYDFTYNVTDRKNGNMEEVAKLVGVYLEHGSAAGVTPVAVVEGPTKEYNKVNYKEITDTSEIFTAYKNGYTVNKEADVSSAADDAAGEEVDDGETAGV